MFEYLGLVLTVLSWLSGAYLVRKWQGSNAMSLSLHASSNKIAFQLFATVLVIIGGTFYAWLLLWLAPHLGLSGIFILLVTLTILCLFIAALVPDSSGNKRRVHRIAAYTMAYLYLPLIYP
jgi:hypothetical protein